MKTAFFLLHPATCILLFAGAHAPAQTGCDNALSFDGINDQVLVPQFGKRAPTTEITVEFWQNVSAFAFQQTFALAPDLETNRMLAHTPWCDGVVYWDLGNNTGGGRLSYAPPASIINSWQHFALVASQSGNFMRIYRNGLLEAQKSGMTPLVRGNYDLCLAGVSPYFFQGQLDEFRIWNVARTQAEIQAHMNHPLVGTESNLVAYWPFDDPLPGPTTKDRTGLGNTGVLVDGPVWRPRTEHPLRRYPLLQASRGLPGQLVLAGDAVPGTGFQLLTATNLPGPWGPIPAAPPVQATATVLETTLNLDPVPHFFRSQLEPVIYAITNCMVTDNAAIVPVEYTGVGLNLATLPYIRYVTGVKVMGGDVNIGIGGSTTTVWAKYCRLGAWDDPAIPVLTDLAAVPWPSWNPFCPDGHLLTGTTPVCPDGWQRASGTSGGLKGALTWAVNSPCWHMGLCIRYRPLGQVVAQNLAYIHKLSLSRTTSGVAFPPGEVGWEIGGLDIHSQCTDTQDVYLCFRKERPN